MPFLEYCANISEILHNIPPTYSIFESIVLQKFSWNICKEFNHSIGVFSLVFVCVRRFFKKKYLPTSLSIVICYKISLELKREIQHSRVICHTIFDLFGLTFREILTMLKATSWQKYPRNRLWFIWFAHDNMIDNMLVVLLGRSITSPYLFKFFLKEELL